MTTENKTSESKSDKLKIVSPIEYLSIAERIDSIKNDDEMTNAIKEIRSFIIALSVKETQLNKFSKRRNLLGTCTDIFTVLEEL